MNQNDAIKAAMKYRKVKAVYIAQKLGIAEPTFSRYFSSKGNGTNGNVRLETLCKILDAIDYEVVIKPKDSKKDGVFTIRFESNGEDGDK